MGQIRTSIRLWNRARRLERSGEEDVNCGYDETSDTERQLRDEGAGDVSASYKGKNRV